MRNPRSTALAIPFPKILAWVAGTLLIVYIGLIAAVMSYAALTVEFTQSVRSSHARVAKLEKQYLAAVAAITATEYGALGYAKPQQKVFVRAKSGTALR